MPPSPLTPRTIASSLPLHAAPQVGGHIGVQTTEDGSLLLKPTLPLEVEFYQRLTSDSVYAPLRSYVPTFYGTLRLEGKVETSETAVSAAVNANWNEGEIKITAMEGVSVEEKETLVLQNILHGFTKPNVIDIKLGTVLYDETASPEKRARMEKAARDTTSLETGIRLTGFQVHTNDAPEPVLTPKAYGKSIKASQLPEGIARFFPVSSTSAQSSGLPHHLLLPILQNLRNDVDEMRNVLNEMHLRMVGASILIVYEADWKRIEEAINFYEVGGSEEENNAGLAVNEGQEEDESEDDEDESPAPPYALKLIDFAHTRLVPGQGPDQGVLLGIDTLLKLLDGRIEEVEKCTGTA